METLALRHKNTVAGAVVRAILRTEIDAGYLIAEGAAYKCGFHAMGSPAAKHCADADHDYRIMLNGVRVGGPYWPVLGP